MRDSKTNRSVVWKQAYWARVLELYDLMDREAQHQALESAHSNRLPRKTLRRFDELADSSAPVPLTLDAANEVAGRYALWETRRTFDWGSYPSMVRPETRRLDEALVGGIYSLDVTLRRSVEALLRRPETSSSEATALRAAIESRAGRVSAAVALTNESDQHHPDWADLSDYFDRIRNELDHLLTLVGAPAREL